MNKKIFFTSIVLVISFVFGTCLKVSADKNQTGRGWIWGGSEDGNRGGKIGGINCVPNADPQRCLDGNESGYGWISINSLNCDADDNGVFDNPNCSGGVVKYGVNIPSDNGSMSPVTGYAWSENLGWINFGSSCPPGSTDPNCTPPPGCRDGVFRDGNQLVGCARIVSIARAAAVGNSGGWQGWIKMSGPGYGVTISGNSILGCNSINKSCAWNGEDVGAGGNIANGLGWFDFSNLAFVPPKRLKICKNRCDSGWSPINDSEENVSEGDTVNLKACYDSSSGCTDASGDVTSDLLLEWDNTKTPNEAVSANLDIANKKYIVTGRFSGKKEKITARYNNSSLPDDNAQVTISVNCKVTPGFCDLPAQKNLKDSTCKSSFFKDSCGSYTCQGAKDCSAWKEIAPN